MYPSVRFFILTLLIFFGAANVYAAGVQEDRLDTAKKLMAEKKYNEAILVLKDLETAEPDRLDQAEELQRQIRSIIDRSQNLQEQIVEATLADRFDEALALVRELVALDPNPNAATRSIQRQAYKAIAVRQARVQFSAVMSDAKAFLDRQQWGQAARRYLDGYEFMRTEFDAEDYGNLVKTQILQSLQDLRTVAQEYIDKEQEFLAQIDTGQTLIASGSPETLEAALGPVLQTWDSLSILHNRILAAARNFQSQQNLIVLARGEEGRDGFLDYNLLVTRGRQNVDWEEGLYKSLVFPWRQGLTQWSDRFKARMETLLAQGEAAWRRGDAPEARRSFRETALVGLQALRTQSLWNRDLIEDRTDPDAYSTFAYRARLARLWWFQTATLAAEQGQIMAGLLDQIPPQNPQELGTQEALSQLRTALRGAQTQVAGLEAGLDAQRRTLNPFPAPLWNLEQAPGILDRMTQYWQSTRSTLAQRETTVVARQAELTLLPYEAEVVRLEGLFQQVGVQLDGRDDTDSTRYPREAAETLRQIQAPLGQLTSNLTVYLETYRRESTAFGRPANVESWVTRAQEDLVRVNGLANQRLALLGRATTAYNQYLSLRQDTANLLTSARSAVAQGQFTPARNTLNQFQTLVARALAFQTDPEFERQSNQGYAEVLAYLNREENILVVQDVLRFISQGRTAYNNYRFVQAEEIFNRAAARWAQTNADPNPDILRWLNQIKQALSSSSNRELNPTDPLFPEMQQLLNFAQRAFDRALATTNQNSKNALLNEAIDYVNKVKLAFPFHQEARVLGLRIDQLRDPEGFRTYLADYYAAARTKSLNPNRQTKLEGYQELQDVINFDRNYPGAEAEFIRTAEDLGFRQRPPDPRLKSESLRLTAQAKSIYDASDVNRFRTAITLLDQAIALDATNTAAEDLKVILLGATGAPATGMPPGDQAVFDRAQTLYAEGKTRQALTELRKLLTTGRYRTNAAVQQLRQKLEGTGP